MDSDRGIPLGRAAFLGTIVAGIGGIALTSRFSDAVSSAMSGVAGAIPVVNEIAPTSGWRIYAVNPPMPEFDPATYRLKIGGQVDNPVELTYADLLADARGRAGVRLPLRDGLVGAQRQVARRAAADAGRPREAARRACGR